jgi:hypothetical protein
VHQGQAGLGQASVDQVRTILDLLQAAFDDANELAKIGDGEVSKNALGRAYAPVRAERVGQPDDFIVLQRDLLSVGPR